MYLWIADKYRWRGAIPDSQDRTILFIPFPEKYPALLFGYIEPISDKWPGSLIAWGWRHIRRLCNVVRDDEHDENYSENAYPMSNPIIEERVCGHQCWRVGGYNRPG